MDDRHKGQFVCYVSPKGLILTGIIMDITSETVVVRTGLDEEVVLPLSDFPSLQDVLEDG